MNTTLYRGWRNSAGICHVVVIEGTHVTPLPLRLDLQNHSLGFEWGFGGSGPAQLALALLAHAMHDDEIAVREHLRFKDHVLLDLPRRDDGIEWEFTREDIASLVEEMFGPVAA